MKREELVSMLNDMDSLGWFVHHRMAIMPAEIKEKAEAAEQVQSVKYGIVKLLEEYDRSNGTSDQITDRI